MGKGKTILLVEDEEYVYEVSMLMLQRLGYTVLGAKSGAEAVDIFKANMESIDLVLLDMVMPDMDGARTFDILKKMKFDVNVLLSTGYDENEIVEMLLAAGCKGCVQKPYTMNNLKAKLSAILN